MANISQVQVGGTTYDICDATARDSISSLQVISVKNKNSFSINANESFTHSFSLDNLNFDSSYFIISPIGIVNNHSTATTLAGWYMDLTSRRIIGVTIRNMYSSTFVYNSENLRVHLLISNNSLFKPTQDLTSYSVASAG